MEPLKSVKLLDDNQTLQPYAVQPVYAKNPVLKDKWPKIFNVKTAPVAWDLAAGLLGKCNFDGDTSPVAWALTARPLVKRDMVYARDLCIIHGANVRYWKWKRVQQMPMFEVAELKNVTRLEVTGKYDMKNLEAGTYEFTFVTKIEQGLCFGSRPTKFSITLPHKGGYEVKRVEIVKHVNIMALKGQTNTLIHVKLGDVKCTGSGEVNFSLINLSLDWKKGLTIVGVYINPLVILS